MPKRRSLLGIPSMEGLGILHDYENECERNCDEKYDGAKATLARTSATGVRTGMAGRDFAKRRHSFTSATCFPIRAGFLDGWRWLCIAPLPVASVAIEPSGTFLPRTERSLRVIELLCASCTGKAQSGRPTRCWALDNTPLGRRSCAEEQHYQEGNEESGTRAKEKFCCEAHLYA